MSTDPKWHPNAEVVGLLRRTLDLLGGPQKNGGNLAKVEEAHSFTESGIGCEAWDETAARWTITGALARFSMQILPWHRLPAVGESASSPLPFRNLRNEVLFDDAFHYLFAAAILAAPQTVNGVNNRGWDAARDLIEFAILLAEHEASIMPMLILPSGKHPSPELRKRLEQILQARGIQNVQVPS